MRSGSTDDHCDLIRRRLALGLPLGVALGGLPPGMVMAQTASGSPPLAFPPPALPPTVPEAEDGASLFANLFTRMSVRTRLNGHGPFDFVIDTGASRTAVAHEVATTLGLEATETVVVHGVTSAQIAPTAKLARLEAAGRRFTDLDPCLFPRADLAADGLLGLDVLSRYNLELDIARSAISLTPSGPDRIIFGRAFDTPTRLVRSEPLRSRRGRFGQLILMNARVEGVAADCFVDSGAQYSIGNPALQRAVGERAGRSAFLNPIRVFGVTGQVLQAWPGTVSQLDLARQRLGRTRLLFADLHAFRALDLDQRPALLLGADIIGRFSRVSLDFGLSRMTFSGLRRPPNAIQAA